MSIRVSPGSSLLLVACAVLALGPMAGCDPEATPDVIETCETSDDCAWLDPGECRLADCIRGSCVAATDYSANGDTCGLSDLCAASGGTCSDGECSGVRPVLCPEVDCMIGSCDRDTGECVYHEGPAGVACDLDGNPCTRDECSGGSCKAGPNDCPCRGQDDCPDPEDRCLGTYECRKNYCVIDPMTAVVCPADGPCQTFACDAGTGQCLRTNRDDGTRCSEADACNLAGTCGDGFCDARPRCDDGNPCTENVCDPESGACSYPPGEGGCDDGDLCTGPDQCFQGTCTGPALTCFDFSDCTADSCDPLIGCVNTPLDAGIACESSDLCIVEMECDGLGACAGGRGKCDDENQCTSDSCDAISGQCTHGDLIGACDDGNRCTTGEQCGSGVCSGGDPVPGCCNFDLDCEDGDLCTESDCDQGTCLHKGEPVGLCGAGEGCGVLWCLGSTGACVEPDAGFPVALLSWDLSDGAQRQGFAWGPRPGVFGTEGAAVEPGKSDADVQFPARVVPDGVIEAWVGLASGDCEQVTFSPSPAASECVHSKDRQWLVAAFDRAVLSDGRLNLQMGIASGAVVADVRLVLLAVSGCPPAGLVLADTAAAQDPAVNSSADGIAVVWNNGAWMGSAVIGTGGQVVQSRFAQYEYGVVAGRFSTSLVESGKGWVAAWGSADSRVWLGGVGADGVPSSAFRMPDVAAENEIQAWPSLAVDSSGRPVAAFAYGAAGDFDIAAAVVDGLFTTPSVVSMNKVNDSSTGSRSRPKLSFGDSGGIVTWISEVTEPAKQYMASLRSVGTNVAPTGLEVAFGVQSELVSDISVVQSNSRYFCVWQKADGSLGGVVLDAATLGQQATFQLGGAASPRSRPILLPSADGAVVVSIVGTGATASVVAESVAPDGTAAPGTTVAGPVIQSLTTIAAAPFGPLHYVLAYTDQLAAQPGIRLVVFSPRCAGGFVSDSAACTGLGGSGRAGGLLP